jgi:uncharacterized membrane protein YhiD involved in acid resistance
MNWMPVIFISIICASVVISVAIVAAMKMYVARFQFEQVVEYVDEEEEEEEEEEEDEEYEEEGLTDDQLRELGQMFVSAVSVIKPEWGERINQLEQQKLDNRLKLQDVRKEAAHADLMEIRAEQERRELNEESDRRSEREYEFD